MSHANVPDDCPFEPDAPKQSEPVAEQVEAHRVPYTSKAVKKLLEHVEGLEADAPMAGVFYLAWSAIKFPMNYGIGIHGYVLSQEIAKKGYGLKKTIATDKGYVVGSEEKQRVIDHIVDIRQGFPGAHNDSGLIIQAANHVLNYVLSNEGNLGSVHLVAPSTTYQRLLNSGVSKLRDNNWVGRNGEAAPFKEHAEAFLRAIETLREKGVKVSFDSQDVANQGFTSAKTNAVDMLVAVVKNGSSDPECNVAPPEGYWNYTTGRHPLLPRSKLLFVTNTALPEGRRYFHMVDYEAGTKKKEEVHKRDIEVGQRLASTALTVSTLDQVDPVIDLLIEEQNKYTPIGERRVGLLFLDGVYKPSVHQRLMANGTAYIRPNGLTIDLVDSQLTMLSHELYPPRQALREVDNLSQLEVLLKEVVEATEGKELAEPKHLVSMARGDVLVCDITSFVFSVKEDDKGKKKYGVTPEMEVPNTSLDVQAFYRNGEGKCVPYAVKLSIGMDMPKRNTAAALAGDDVRAYLVSHMESEMSVGHEVVLIKGTESGIWAMPHAGKTFITQSAENK